ncbi:MAG: hypothetical protein ACLTYN_06820 [Dysosmobacter welbionis]
MATTYNNLYLDIRQQLRRAGIEEATLEARELVCFGTNKSREELARDGDCTPPGAGAPGPGPGAAASGGRAGGIPYR